MLGIDPSLNSTGYSYWNNEGGLVTGTVTSGKLRGAPRLFYQRMMVAQVIEKANPNLIVMEDYAMGARGNNMFNIGELGGVLKTYFWENGYRLLPIPPTVMKSVIAGNGRADKDGVIRALAQRFGIRVLQHDEADAVGLMLVGEMKCGLRSDASTSLKGRAQSNRFESVRCAAILPGKGNGKMKLIAKRATAA